METPLYSALLNHANVKPTSLHVPGHKNGAVFLQEANHLYKDILQIDVTELTGLDDLHHPQDVILKAQQLTSELYRVKSSYFLVNGSTVGNLAMILASCQVDDVVLVQRNSHKSIMNGLQLAGVRPVFLDPKVDEELIVPSYVEFERIKEAIRLYPNAKVLILTNPNYYGLATDLAEIVTYAHDHGIPVLVDEAHGAHFIIGDRFPLSAVEIGADIVIHSAHKTLPAMTMGSFLHFNSDLIDKEIVESYLSMLQSSSPSYPIMASLDLARAYLSKTMEENLQVDIIESVKKIKQQIGAIKGLEIIESHDRLVKGDPLKLTIRSTNGLSGYELQEVLEKHNAFIELANPEHCLCILPLGDMNPIINKITQINPDHLKSKKTRLATKKLKRQEVKGIQPLEVSYFYLKKCKKVLIELDDSIGHYSAEAIIPYPPGIPLIMVGEKITKELVEKIRRMIELGVNIQGDYHIKKGKINIYMSKG
ncbi:aminotransferase class I/II-fold pyridoxal phosphate-dependent enzyme [Metabacillus halosaccharovorans]|uniref:aminotransferase class I/II-fold pyridoxal phosphate-dependent enzyme n=1 Tax=Metabacillus halosaccharovorans TaxID=930124 RepID=UPI001C1F7B21|nr:aminotransferase class I/II-fold pyridoxal phosphate-dependent enzyme [Metabacillus halosaccharovorans]MBU7594115.1 aminotransferase class I/II-fold pyridoxal phosphate-dependent enzyme [Metabacillus halosaccharovorans]